MNFRLGAIALLIGAGPMAASASAMSLTAGAGVQELIRNDLATDAAAQGYQLHGEAAWSPSSFSALQLGLALDSTYFAIDSTSSDTTVDVTKTGTIISGAVAPTVTLMAPWDWFQPYIAAGYRYGSVQFTQDSTSLMTSTDGTVMTTDIYTRLNMVSSGSHTRLGVRFGQEWGVRLEYGVVYELWTVKSVNFSFSNRIDGEVQPLDSNDQTYTSLVEGLIGERYSHVANSVIIAIDWMIP